MKAKTSSASLAITTDIILPSDTNALHGLFGGELLARVDRICCIAAQRHANAICVTVSVNNVSFGKVIPLGSMMTIEAKVSRSFSSSMEVIADVFLEDRNSGEKTKVNEAIYTFVAVDNHGKPIPVPELIPETDLEKQRYQNALQRRQLSLVVAGKMKPKEATELQALFK
ncbi:acyl-CoA thioesterase [Wenyingzhuangia fucanilytica]|uniref:Acyl-CoA thioesterase n=1 Tax=Wenyingzhuangia fucanilytica TaxID=1790137 RepID=A0A1B1Y9B1_9FLAO|nr:acyl-CoA thioesterase [Wenyingzhuangia fucanilytica]ANW97371.1 acyl-CoA thioesterase [Wenyingzhuangia fucanilytica]